MGHQGGLRDVWSDLLNCCTPMQGEDFQGLPERPNAFSTPHSRPPGQVNMDLRVHAYGESAPQIKRSPSAGHRQPEVGVASWDMASHISPREIAAAASKNRGGQQPVSKTVYPEGSSWANPPPPPAPPGASIPRDVAFFLVTAPPPFPVPNRTSLVSPLVLSGRAACLTPY